MDNQKATLQAIATLKISGFEFNQESKKMWAKVENNELSTNDVRLITNEKLERLRIEQPEYFVVLNNEEEVG